MGDCLTSVKSPELPQNTGQHTQQAFLLAPTPVSTHSTGAPPSTPNIQVLPPPKQQHAIYREPSIDLRELEEGGINSSLSSFSHSRESGQVEICHTDSYVVRKLEEGRRSSGLPVQIKQTNSYLVDGGRGRTDEDVTLSLVDGQIVVSRAQPFSRAGIEQSTVVPMRRMESAEENGFSRPVVEQSAVFVNTRVNQRAEPAYPRPTIDQSAIIIQTRLDRP